MSADPAKEAVKRFRRRLKDVLEHEPKELHIAINGRILGSQSINSDINRQSLLLDTTEKLEFVEVFSEQGRHFGTIPVKCPPADCQNLAFNGPDKKPGNVTIRAGELIQGPDKEPALGKVRDTLRWVVHSGKTRDFYVRATPPTRVEVQVSPTFSPHEFGNSSDRRRLGAQVTYELTSKPPPGR